MEQGIMISAEFRIETGNSKTTNNISLDKVWVSDEVVRTICRVVYEEDLEESMDFFTNHYSFALHPAQEIDLIKYQLYQFAKKSQYDLELGDAKRSLIFKHLDALTFFGRLLAMCENYPLASLIAEECVHSEGHNRGATS